MKDSSLTYTNKPLNQDISNLLFEENNIYYRLNMDVITQYGDNGYDSSNSLGNKSLISLPKPTQVWKFGFSKDPIITPITITIVVDGDPTSFVILANGTFTTYLEIIKTIKQYYPGKEVNAALVDDNSSILIYSPLCKDITFTTDYSLFFSTNELYIDTLSSNINIIGWISDSLGDLYVITTGEQGYPLESGIPSLGQFWKVSYEKGHELSSNSFNASFELIYNNFLNLTTQKLIKNPTQIEIAEQNNKIKSIYFTDYYNILRRINVNDANVFGVIPDNLSLYSKMVWTTPYVSEILQNTGSIEVGYHSFAFRYVNLSGARTNSSPESVFIPITDENDGADYIAYPGNLNKGKTSKSLKIIINELDTKYDYIELIHIHADDSNTIKTIEVIDGVKPVTKSFTYTYSGNEITIPITLSEFRAINVTFNKVKTIESKDNYLFLGNVEIPKRELTGYDTRAVRFPKDNLGDTQTTTTVYDRLGNPYIVDSNTWTPSSLSSNVGEEHDCIQDIDVINNLAPGLSQNPTSAYNYLYSKGPTMNENHGGEGPNIKYSFLNNFQNYDGNYIPIYLDIYGTADFGTTYPSYLPILNVPHSDGSLKLNDDNTFPRNNNNWSDYNSPFIAAHCKNWMRDEVYAFGIEFFDLYGIPYMTKWIADIRIPATYMAHISDPRSLWFAPIDVSGDNTVANPLGIKFELSNLNTIADRVSGFRIVYVKRNDKNKTITGQGLFIHAEYDSFDGKHFLCSCSHGQDPYLNNLNVSTSGEVSQILDRTGLPGYNGIGPTYYIDTTVASIQSPDYNLYKTPVKPTHIDFSHLLNLQFWLRAQKSNPNQLQDYSAIGKYYSIYGSALDVHTRGWDNLGHMYPLNECVLTGDNIVVDETQHLTLQNTLNIYNRSFSDNQLAYRGGRTYVLTVDSGLFANLYVAASEYNTNSGGRFIANLKNNIIPYLGNDYTARSLREYTACTNFIPIRNGDTSKVAKTYAGDTFINIYVDNKYKKWFGSQPFNDSNSYNVVHAFPVESTVNLAWRTENTLNCDKTRFNDNFTGIDYNQSFSYLSFSTNPLDASAYYPKPFPFIENNIFDKRVYASEKKQQDELFDSWSVIKANNFIDLDTGLGELNGLARIKSNLYFLQENGVGVLSVNERVLLQANETSKLILGTGEILQRADYLTTESGTRHQSSIHITEGSLFYFDIKNLKHMSVGESSIESLSDIKGLKSFYIKTLLDQIYLSDNPLMESGMACIFDARNLKNIFSYHDRRDNDFTVSNTVSYSAMINGYDTFYSFTPYMYMQNRWDYFSVKKGLNNQIWIHNQNNYCNYYGEQFPSEITVQFNKNPYITKIYDNIILSTEVVDETLKVISYQSPSLGFSFDKIRFNNSYQNTDWKDFNSISRLREKYWNIAIPRDFVINPNISIFDQNNLYTIANKINFLPQLKDRFLNVDLKYENLNNYKISLKMLQLNYRTT